MKLMATVVGACVIATVLSACSGSNNKPSTSSKAGSGGSGSSATSGGKTVNDGTFNFAMSADPGALDPQASAASNTFQITQFAYDNLLSENTGGKIESALATKWQVTGKTVVLTIHPGVTCSDGATFTAADVAANINYVADPKNKSPFLGVFLPAGAKATAAGDTVTMTLAAAAPFVLNGLANVPMVCAKGMANRKSLARATDGTGAFKLTEAVSGDHYTYTRRAGYTWGPNGATTATAGLPAKIVVKIIPNETTAANLLLAGSVNAATILGADTARLDAAHLFSANLNAIAGEMWFNQAKGRPAADPAVRLAMTQAVDLTQLAKVLTSGKGGPGTTFAPDSPSACPGNSIAANLPTHDLDKAKQTLDTAGWKAGSGGVRSKDGKSLTMTFVYNTQSGAAGSATAELAAAAWKQLGVKVNLKPQDETTVNQTIFSTGNWDVIWEGLNVSSPDQIVPFMSGTAAPNGTNFAHINNAAYNAGVATASKTVGTAGCADWLKAEGELVKTADVIPFANQVTKTYGYHTTFTISGELIPTSIRMLAS
jgi:peptide/nickel transport system substrate-binding protein